MSIKQGKQTYINDCKVYIKETAAIVGPREKAGPLGEYFDEVQQEDYDEKTWEKAEAKFANAAFQKLMRKIDKKSDDIDCILAGDLMNQCIASSLGLRDSDIPYLGLFGACSTIAEGMTTASLLINSGGMSHVICMASSNFCSAEKTFRMPVEQGGQRPPTAQWTVTASGALLISSEPGGPLITSVTIGKITDYDITDSNNMGAAMAPAAADTILAHLSDLGIDANYYDAIVTGDLGLTGSGILRELMDLHGCSLYCPEEDRFIHQDCGAMIFDPVKQKTNSGGSGCGCGTAVFANYFYKQLQEGILKRILFVGTGALMSPISVKQAESISGIAHAVAIEAQ